MEVFGKVGKMFILQPKPDLARQADLTDRSALDLSV